MSEVTFRLYFTVALTQSVAPSLMSRHVEVQAAPAALLALVDQLKTAASDPGSSLFRGSTTGFMDTTSASVTFTEPSDNGDGQPDSSSSSGIDLMLVGAAAAGILVLAVGGVLWRRRRRRVLRASSSAPKVDVLGSTLSAAVIHHDRSAQRADNSSFRHGRLPQLAPDNAVPQQAVVKPAQAVSAYPWDPFGGAGKVTYISTAHNH